MRGVAASAHSLSKMNFCTALQPGPPYCSGQWLASQPRALRIACHSSMSALLRCLLSRTLACSRAGYLSARKPRTSSRKASSSGVNVRSMSPRSENLEQAGGDQAAGNSRQLHDRASRDPRPLKPTVPTKPGPPSFPPRIRLCRSVGGRPCRPRRILRSGPSPGTKGPPDLWCPGSAPRGVASASELGGFISGGGLVQAVEIGAALDQLDEQRRRLPEQRVLLRELADVGQHLRQARPCRRTSSARRGSAGSRSRRGRSRRRRAGAARCAGARRWRLR